MSPVFAVIPSAVVLGPLAVLAAVFPGATIGGGWVNLLSSPAVTSLDSTGRRAMFIISGSITDRNTGRAAAVVFQLKASVPVD